MNRILLAPDPDDKGVDPLPKPADAKPAPPAPAGPPSVPGVKNTPLKHPAVIALEKKVSELEDKQDALTEALQGVNTVLEDLKIGGPSPVPIKNKKGALQDPAPAPGGFFDEIDRLLWGNSNR